MSKDKDQSYRHDEDIKGEGAGVDPIPDPDPNNHRGAADLLEEAVGESVDKLKDDFTHDDKPDKDKH